MRPRQGLVLGGGVVDVDDGLLGDDEQVHGRGGVDIANGDHLGVLVDLLGGDLTRDDLGEDGV